MTVYNILTEDDKGRQIHGVLFNTAKDGSGTWYFGIVDSDGHLQADVLSIAAGSNIIGKIGHDVTGLTSGSKAVTAAGTAERLAAITASAKWTLVQAKPANTQRVAVGGSTVDETAATVKGTILYSGEMVWLPLDPYDIFCDPQVSGEGVTFNYLT